MLIAVRPVVKSALVALCATGLAVASWNRPAGFTISAAAAIALLILTKPRRRGWPFAIVGGAFLLSAIPAAIAAPVFAPTLAPLLRRSRLYWREAALGVAVGMASALVSVVWWYHRPGFAFYQFLPSFVLALHNPWISIAVCLVAAIFNACWEEVLWRGVFTNGLAAVPWYPRILFLSVLFGAAHWNSLPSGLVGALMTFAFAIAAHLLSGRAGRRLLSAVIAHVVADAALLILITMTS